MKVISTIFTALTLLTSFSAQGATVGVQIILDSTLLDDRPPVAGAAGYPNGWPLIPAKTKSELEGIITSWIEEANEYYTNSGVDINLYVTNLSYRNITNKAAPFTALGILDNMVSAAYPAGRAEAFGGMVAEADRLGSDFVVAIVPDGSEQCGQAKRIPLNVNEYLDPNKKVLTRYAVSRLACGSKTFSHELGHLMGLTHGSKAEECEGVSATPGLTSFGKGYGVGTCGQTNATTGFREIMAGNHLRSFTNFAPYFSNPRIQNASICLGTAQNICGDAVIGDAARALQTNKDAYANREYPDVDQITYKDPALKTCVQKYVNAESNELTQVDCVGSGISDISGLSQLTNLNSILLAYNKIFRVKELMGVTSSSLQQIDLTNNYGADCNEVAALAQKFSGKVVAPASCFSSVSLPATLGFIL
jgi:Leucine-rich repeat (LRR) protein